MIVGAGIAGLHCAVALAERYPRRRITLFEKYKYLGGRVFTFKNDLPNGQHVQWEAGAGRISENHTQVLNLLKKYGLHTVPISPEIQYKKSYDSAIEPNLFEPTISILLKPLEGLPKEVLGTQTLRDLFTKIHGEAVTTDFFNRFPYRGEVDVMRADRALQLFAGEMGTHEGYVVCKEGLSELISRMRADFVKRGGVVKTHHELKDLAENDGRVHATFQHGEKLVRVFAERAILAVHVEGLRNIPLFANWLPLKHLKMTALLRTYAVYPTDWSKGLTRIVTATPIRYFLPMNPGTAMVSYTDTQDTTALMAMKEPAMGEYIQKELRRLFPDRKIPDYLFFKSHPWKAGVTYWLPGDYVPEEESEEAIRFSDRIHLCGESFACCQGWMEGAVKHANQLLRYLDTL
jgi:hypothetical protein